MTKQFHVACAALGCAACSGNADCPSLDAYRRRYGETVNKDAALDLDVWFPRSEAPRAIDAATTTEETHDRLAHGGYEAGQQREAEKAAAHRPRVPEWVRRKIDAKRKN